MTLPLWAYGCRWHGGRCVEIIERDGVTYLVVRHCA